MCSKKTIKVVGGMSRVFREISRGLGELIKDLCRAVSTEQQ